MIIAVIMFFVNIFSLQICACEWTIHQLNQMPKKDFEFDETVDLSELSQSSEIRSISPVRVKGREARSSRLKW